MDDIQEWLALINSWEPKLRLEVLGASRSLDTVPLPESAFQRVERSFGTLAEPARLVASALVVFTVPASLADIETLVDMSTAQATDHLARLVEHGLAEEIEGQTGRAAG